MFPKRTRPWCVLCRFDFIRGEHVNITTHRRDTVSQHHYTFTGSCVTKPEEHQSTQYESEDDNSDYDGYGSWYSTLEEVPPDQLVHFCHYTCAKDLSPRALQVILEIVRYEFVPSLLDLKRRRQWLQTKFAQDLSDHRSDHIIGLHDLTGSFQRQVAFMPPELRLCLVQFCLPQLTIACLTKAASLNAKPPLASVKAQCSIWATYVRFEGIWYISTLTNQSPGDEDKRSVLVWKPTGSLSVIHIARDHLGIRKIIPDCKAQSITCCPGLWWVSIPLKQHTVFQCQSDGLKLRRLSSIGYEESLWNTVWPKPQYTTLKICTLPRSAQLGTRRIIRMSSLYPDSLSIRGYSALWNHKVVSIQTHGLDEEDLSCYRAWAASHSHAYWLYMPVDRDEFINEIWRTRCSQHADPILIMKTNHGRTWEIGPRPRDQRRHDWHLIGQLERDDHVFLENSWTGIGLMTFSQAINSHQQVRPPAIATHTPYPLARVGVLFFCTSAPLTDVAAIRLCKRDGIVIGLLLCYHSGQERAVGQIRFDHLQQRDKTSSTRNLIYALDATKVVDMKLETANEQSGWIVLPWSGRLVWWFSGIDCKLYHEDE